jgi:spore photoproduct lyase
MWKPKKIYYEKSVKQYFLGKILLEKYEDVPKEEIESHNNIIEMRQKQNSDFPSMKNNLILGIRKTHKYIPNYKVSDYLVPYTSSGCTAMCMYCYLVCHYNKCAYLRIFVNREEMLERLIKFSERQEKDLVFEIGSNSDVVLENTITGNLKWTIEKFSECKKGYLTFPTKFDMIDDILDIKGKERVIIRMSVNPDEIITKVELKTSSLEKRIVAINKLVGAGYKVGILIAPVILVEDWKNLYEELFVTLDRELSDEAKSIVFFEVIFMTYSFIHNVINKDAFPNAIKIYDKSLMIGSGKGKYRYRPEIKEQAKIYIENLLNIYFPSNKIIYIV